MKKRGQVIGIDPLVDFAFKLLLGSPEHWRVTVHFLNAILRNEPQITHVVFQNPIQGKSHDNDKLSILDILATDREGRQFNIEVQTTVPTGLRQRLAYYDARLYVNQFTEGTHYRDLKPAIVICVLSQALFPQQPGLHSDFRFRTESGLVLTDDLQVHLLELTKLTVRRENLPEASPLERWAYFLINAQSMTSSEISTILPESEFVEAVEILEMIKQTPEQLHEYSARMKLRLDEAARIEHASETARAEGLQEGETRGTLVGRIEILQEVLGLESPTADEIATYDLPRLTALEQRLRKKLRGRPQ